MEQNKDQVGAAVRGEAVARLMYWCGPSHYAVHHGGVCARTYSEFSKGAGENGGYWKEGEELFTTSNLSARAADAPSEPTNAAHHARLVLIRELGDAELVESVRHGKVSIRAALLKVLGAADALDSHPDGKWMPRKLTQAMADVLEFGRKQPVHNTYLNLLAAAPDPLGSQTTDGGVRNG